ncbi:MAG: cupredoxin domain-containing protein [Proteobacteria bacterium]|nr:cupredoxin domain-containing protein [Pseudomonadota bacterium]HQR04589.1 cupredoxin domain-containing protein [Rhodocyclaceae bacterium]
MNALPRRQALRQIAGWMMIVGAGVPCIRQLHAEETAERVIEIEARRFQYTPSQIVARRGETVTLAVRAIDFTHGFSLPELGTRIDLIPGRVVKLRLQLTRAGRFTYLCDNFCGDGHEGMNGTLIVEES